MQDYVDEASVVSAIDVLSDEHFMLTKLRTEELLLMLIGSLRLVVDGHRSRPCWGAGGDQRLLQLSIGTKGSLLCVKVV